jgi:hypothetical protein
MVFVDERWGDRGNMKWDAASWQERLEMCAAGECFLYLSKIFFLLLLSFITRWHVAFIQASIAI